jgi:hypothetical protein
MIRFPPAVGNDVDSSKRLRRFTGCSRTMHEYREVGWRERFHRQKLVSREALRLICEAGGRDYKFSPSDSDFQSAPATLREREQGTGGANLCVAS